MEMPVTVKLELDFYLQLLSTFVSEASRLSQKGQVCEPANWWLKRASLTIAIPPDLDGLMSGVYTGLPVQ